MSQRDAISAHVNKQTTIAAGATGLSAAVPCLGLILIGIGFPSTWVDADIHFQGSVDGGETYRELEDEDSAAIVWVAGTDEATFHLVLPASSRIRGFTHIKLRSGPPSAPIDQTATRTLDLIFEVAQS